MPSRPTADVSPTTVPDDTTQPQQPPQCKSPPPTPSLKESRAFEHDRQRLKKAAARLSRKARKAEAKTQPAVTRQARGGAGVRVDDDEPAVEESEVEWGEARSLSLRLGPPADAEREREREKPRRRAEVTLIDLLIARKPRHGREPDFEVVPPLRSVIVLDDTSAPELDFDEPWEHIYTSEADEHNRSGLSYAKIAALN